MDKKALVAEDLFERENLLDLAASIETELDIESSNASGSIFVRCRFTGTSFLVKVSFYEYSCHEEHLDGELTAGTARNPEGNVVGFETDTEIAILSALKDAIISADYSPGIVELLYSKRLKMTKYKLADSVCERLRTTPGPFTRAEKFMRLLCRKISFAKMSLGIDRIAFIVMEECSITLTKFLTNLNHAAVNVDVFRSIMFQIIHTMYTIRRVFPQFRHCDLHTDNILLKFDSHYEMPHEHERLEFPVGDDSFYVPYYGVIAKLIDFSRSVLPERDVYSSYSVGRWYRITHDDHNELIQLLHAVYVMTRYDYMLNAAVAPILDALEPLGVFKVYDDETVKKEMPKINTYEQMLMSGAFDAYRVPVPAERICKTFKHPPPAKTG